MGQGHGREQGSPGGLSTRAGVAAARPAAVLPAQRVWQGWVTSLTMHWTSCSVGAQYIAGEDGAAVREVVAAAGAWAATLTSHGFLRHTVAPSTVQTTLISGAQYIEGAAPVVAVAGALTWGAAVATPAAGPAASADAHVDTATARQIADAERIRLTMDISFLLHRGAPMRRPLL